MPIAAVPEYLRSDYRDASPGLRFGLYLRVWTTRDDQEAEVRKRAEAKSGEGKEISRLLQGGGMDAAVAALERSKRLPGVWKKNDFAGREAWKSVGELAPDDKARTSAVVTRQDALAEPLAAAGQLLTLDASATAPFTTGLGNEHPLENGFAFLNPYGLPYLPGSGVKGVLRQAARELAGVPGSATWDIDSGWTVSAIGALFGHEDANDARRGALTFWDVIPRLKGDTLAVEVMTAHQSHYHQKGETPHESGQPNPINFLTVPAGSLFTFHVQCNPRLLPEDLARDERWQVLLREAFAHAFEWLGFGAKTAVGYGAMATDETRARQRAETLQRRQAAEEEQRRLEAVTAGLPEDAAWLRTQELQGSWSDTNRLMEALEGWLADRESLSQEAVEALREVLDGRWPGITADPDGVKGKKKDKPRYKPRPRSLAKRFLELAARP